MRPTTILLTLFLIGGITGDIFATKVAAADTHINSGRSTTGISVPKREEGRPLPAASKSIPRIRPASRGEKTTLRVGITAYTLTGNRTASGEWPRVGRTIAVNPAKIPLGSKVYIEGVGARVAEDVIPESSIKKGADIDIYFGKGEQAVRDAVKWGRKKKWKAWIVELPKGAKQ